MSSRTLQIEKVTSLLEEAYAIRVNNLQKSVALTNEALAIARELSDAALTGKCLNQISLFYMNLGENQLSMEASREAIQHFTELNDEMGIADAKFNIASVSYKSDDYHAGLTNLVEALAIYRKHNAYGKESRTCKALGTIYEFFGDAKNALTSYHRAVDAAKKSEI